MCYVVMVATASFAAAPIDSFTCPPFGTVHLYHPANFPREIVVFVSGESGWNHGVIGMAETLAVRGALVAGVNMATYERTLNAGSEQCLYPASDFETLSQTVQLREKLPEYRQPILVGYSSGATLVYATIAQAPPSAFKGAVSLGFCPGLSLAKLFCKGNGLESHFDAKNKKVICKPDSQLAVPWVVLQGETDQVFNPQSTMAFVRATKGAVLSDIPEVGHGFPIERNWMPAFKAAYDTVAARRFPEERLPSVSELADLPLVEFAPRPPARGVLVVHYTGDGGWGVTDQGISAALADSGCGVAGVNSLKYFWQARTPEGCAADLARIIDAASAKWQCTKVAVIGYSFGADVMPFLINRLPPRTRKKVVLVVLIGPSARADFVFHVGSWFGATTKSSLEVLPEVRKLSPTPVLCFYGKDDKETIAPGMAAEKIARAVTLESGHRVGRGFGTIVSEILNTAGAPTSH
jgi:type IV secretory pathway VirJ component